MPERATKRTPCPICGGYDGAPRGKGLRCFGFVSDDGAYAHCTREEHARGLAMETGAQTYAHRLHGECRCGVVHDVSMDRREVSRVPLGSIVATYDYLDADGQLAYQVVRYAPKTFRQRRPDGQGAWAWNLHGVRPLLYHLPEVCEAIARDQVICLTEGEKDADALMAHGYTATCNSGGAGKWTAAHTAQVRGASQVVVFGDADEVGRAHVSQVCASLALVDIPHAVVELGGAKDISVWLETHDQDALDALIAHAGAPAVEVPAQRPILVQASTVTQGVVSWLWEPYLPRSTLVMLDGDPGLGKSLMVLQVAASLSQAMPFPDQLGKLTVRAQCAGPQSTLILSAEDSLEYQMVPRLHRGGAELSRIHFLRGWLDQEDGEHAFDLQHLPILLEAIRQVRPALVILDPLVAYLGNIDMHRANETRPLMAALGQIADREHCTMLCIRHPSKFDGGGPLMYRGQGNMDLIGAARSGLWVQKHPLHPEDQSMMIQTKSNLGRMGRSVVFSREHGAFQWVGVSRLAEYMLAGGSHGMAPLSLVEAICWLEEHMTPMIPYAWKEIAGEAADSDISERTLSRAKKFLNIRSIKDGERWICTLPSLSLS